MNRLLAWLLLLMVACSARGTDEAARTIVVPGDVNHEALHALERARGRHLTREELLELHRVWIDNEVLYREGLKLPAPPKEAQTREQIIARALSAIDARVRPTAVSDEELGCWLDARRELYEQPALLDFEDAVPAGPSSEQAVRRLAQELQSGTVADAQVRVQVFKGRPEASLAQSYGADVASALGHAPPGEWRAVSAVGGWRAARLLAVHPARSATGDAERAAIRRDYIDAEAARKRDAAVRALWSRYRIEMAETIECLADKG